jgi:quercetin dioxygenase-like cupin family protein
VECWNLNEIDAPDGTRDPVVLYSDDAGRAVMIALSPGQELGDHQVKERMFLVVVDGTITVDGGGDSKECGVGSLLTFAPNERHAVRSERGARILMLLAPWPGEGHFYAGERAASRER